ncbi:MAG: hypothetical protein NC483_00930 [Ruminococcus sp.]|nr:hypothetical protein [Ruminococcus sp.]
MKKIDLRSYLYHGIVDWLNYDNGNTKESFCLNKLESILQSRFIDLVILKDMVLFIMIGLIRILIILRF